MTEKLDRRHFIGATGSALALGAASVAHAQADASHAPRIPGPEPATPLGRSIEALVEQTPLVDTHEHLAPEADRVANLDRQDVTPATDFGMLMSHYTDSDLQVAGLSKDDYQKLIGHELSPKDKWRLVAPYYERCRHTGYQMCVRESVRALFGEDDLREDNCDAISARMREAVRPGYYRHVLREVANIEHAQVNCLKSPVFRENEPPTDLLSFDLWTVGLASNVSLKTLSLCAGTEVTTLAKAHETIDLAFEKYGPKAIAVKDQSAYGRRLDYDDVADEDAAPLFDKLVTDERSVSREERKAIQDNLFRRCLRRAGEMNLPVKLHTGYYAGFGGMPLARVRDNFSDLATLVRDFPETKFVLMHIGYPYQNELIALCKHYPQVYADMCWAWIIDPTSSVAFLKHFITASPACKLFTFGGDYIPVELVPGHARVARRGIALALTQLVEERWLNESDVPALAERIMRGNAREVFNLERILKT